MLSIKIPEKDMKSRQKREEYYAKLMKKIPKTYNEKDITFKNIGKKQLYMYSAQVNTDSPL